MTILLACFTSHKSWLLNKNIWTSKFVGLISIRRSLSAYPVCENKRSQVLGIGSRCRKSPYKRVFVSEVCFCRFNARPANYTSATSDSASSHDRFSKYLSKCRSSLFNARASPSCIRTTSDLKPVKCTIAVSVPKRALVFRCLPIFTSKRPQTSAKVVTRSCNVLVTDSRSNIASSKSFASLFYAEVRYKSSSALNSSCARNSSNLKYL